MNHDAIRALLALSAAGLLDPDAERQVREHARDCPACTAEVASLGQLAAGLCTLPAPQPPPDLLARTQARVAADRDRREAYRLSIAAALCAGTLALVACLELQPYFGSLVWLAGAAIPTFLGAGAVLTLTSRRRMERSLL
jgi:anti-sigma factor RsiW